MTDERFEQLIRGLCAGDQHACRQFCDSYGEALERIAASQLNPALRRRVGPEDVVQSACRTFFRRAQGGQFEFSDSAALWQLLCAITLTKVREQARFHLQQKRDLKREESTGEDSSAGEAMAIPVRGPSPAEAAEFADQFAHFLATLDEQSQRVVDLKLQEFTDKEVATQLGCSELTVRRVQQRLRIHVADVFGVNLPTDGAP